MKKILFATTRNIYHICGEYKLIKNRSMALRNAFGIETDFYGFLSEKKRKRKQDSMEAFADFTAFRPNPFHIVKAYRQFVKKLLKAIGTGAYQGVVISGVFPTNLAGILKRNCDIPIFYDSHGAWEELIEFNPNFKRKIQYHLFRSVERSMLKKADGAFAVSYGLKDYLKETSGWTGETFIVPCALQSRVFSAEDAKGYRKVWREKLGVAEEECLFVYSGGVSPWQSIDAAYRIFKKFQAQYPAKFLILTPNPETVQYEDTMVMSVPAEQVSEVLFAGDVAMLMRSECVTNRVAFPNKYLEYVLSNMLIVSTPYLMDISKEISEEKLGMILRNEADFSADTLLALLKKRESYEEDFQKRNEIVALHSFERTLKPFAERIHKA